MKCHRISEERPLHQVGGYKAWSCPASRDQAFDLLWVSRAGETPHGHRVLPIGEPSIAIRRRRDSGGRRFDAEAVVCSVYDAAFLYRPAPGEELIALRLKPELSAALIGVDAREYRNMEPTLAPRQLISRMSATLRAADKGEAEDIAAALVGDIRKIAGKDAAASKLARRAAAAIRSARGRIDMRMMACEFGVSERYLRRTFRETVGCSPKSYARRTRLAAAAIAADASERPDWAQIALDAGFHDQAHMIADYRSLIDQTPTQNHRERRAGSAFSNTAPPA